MAVAYIEIRFFAHATEDPNKVVEAVKRILPADSVDEVSFKRSNLRGHYGNPIILFETKIREKKIVKAFMEKLSSGLERVDKEALMRKMRLRVERGSLYIRLSKQAALQGKLQLCTADPIRVKIHFKGGKLKDIIEACQKIGILPQPSATNIKTS